MNGKPAEAAAPEQRDRVIALRKSDLIDGLVAEGRLDQAGQATLRQLARMLGAISTINIWKNSTGFARSIFNSTRRSIRRRAVRLGTSKPPIAP